MLSRLSLPALCLFALFNASCDGGKGDRVEITQTRTASQHSSQPQAGLSDAQRFGIAPPPQSKAPTEHPFVWSVPDGWRPAQESQMRIINNSFGPTDAPGECYVTVLPGGGGGALANLNRWRGQVGQDPIDDAALAALEKRPLLGTEAHFLDVSGDYKGVGAAAKSDYRLVGLVHEFPQLTAFVKMIGPAELIEEELENFRTFCESIQFRSRQTGD